MLWALVIMTCTDWNNCVMGKTYYPSLEECKSSYIFKEPKLRDVKLVPFAACLKQESFEQENRDEI